MLTAIRERATGWIAWVIVTLITIPFALWGINSYFEGGGEIPAAKVNGQEISAYQFQEELAVQRQTLSQRLGNNFDPALLETLGVKDQVMEGLIENQLLTQYVADQNFRISDQQLQDLIKRFPAFQQDGKFSTSLYQDVLRANRLSPQGFEESQRVNGALAQLQQGIGDTAFYTKEEQERLLVLQGQKRTAKYAIMKADSYVADFNITEQQISDFYEENQERYQNPARIKLDYIELSIDSLSATVVPSEEEIVTFFEESKGQYKQAESRRASHILLSVPSNATDEEREAQFQVANNVYSQARDGADFGDLAKLYSDDPGSKQNGGDLGIVAKGQMVKPFEDTVYSMSEGEVTGPIETTFGYHVIKLVELTEGSQQTLDEVRSQVADEVKSLKAEQLFSELAESFKNLVFEDPDNLTTAADELDLPIATSDWITEFEGQGVGSEAAVRRAAFSEDVLVDGLVSSAIEVGFDKLIAVQKNQYEAANPKLLDEVKSEIASTLKFELSQEKVFETGTSLLSNLKNAHSAGDWQELLIDQTLESREITGLKSDIDVELITLGDAIFGHAVPSQDQVNFGGLALENGDYVLFMLERVEMGELAGIEEAQKTQIQLQLVARDGSQAYSQFRSQLRNGAEIEVFQDQL